MQKQHINFEPNRRLAINMVKGIGLSLLLFGFVHCKRVAYDDLFTSVMFHEVFYFIPYFIVVFLLFLISGNNAFGRAVAFMASKAAGVVMLLLYLLIMLLPPMRMSHESTLFVLANVLFLAGAVFFTARFNRRDAELRPED